MKDKFKQFIVKVKEFEYKKLLNTKSFLVVGCVAMIGIAVLVSSLLSGNGGEENVLNNESSKILGNPVLVDKNQSTDDVINENNDDIDSEDFFAISIINREKVRDEALDVLRDIAENPDTMPDAKEQALNSINEIIEKMNAEADIEMLIKSKGFEECVSILSEKKCTIIIKAEDLTAADLAQISEIVYEQAEIKPIDINLIKRP